MPSWLKHTLATFREELPMSIMSRTLCAVPLIAAASFVSTSATSSAGAQESAGVGDTTLARQVASSSVSLAHGLSVAGARGKPISGKYELDNGKLQLSIYTARNGRFWEVTVEHRTGRIGKAEEIKEGEDLAAAKSQNDAMSKAKRSLRSAVVRALRANRGYHAVAVTPDLSGGRAVAAIILVRGKSFKSVSEPLD
ncbi:MAG TPA: hypothetical protein DD732_10280 [Rhizobiales bacterium]|jgi:hypothetical protein|nr:hypothetical protein [Hyphomicrobiales bacterium]